MFNRTYEHLEGTTYLRILQSINQIYERAIDCKNVEELGKACLDIINAVTDSKFSFISEIKSDGLLLTIAISDPEAEFSIKPDESWKLTHHFGFKIMGVAASVLLSGKSLVINDPAVVFDSFPLPKAHPNLTAFLGVPLMCDGKVTNIISAWNRKGGYRHEEREIMEAIAPTIIEVLQRRRADDEIIRQNVLLDAIVSNMKDGLTLKDKNGNIILSNYESQYDNNGCTQTSDQTSYIDLNGAPIAAVNLPMNRALNGETVNNYRMIIKQSASVRIAEVTALPIYRNNELTMAVSFSHDITHMIKMQKELEEQKKLLEAVINNMSDGVLIGDSNSNFIFLNEISKWFFSDSETMIKPASPAQRDKYYYGIDGGEIAIKDLPGFKVFNDGKYQDYRITIVKPDNTIYCSVNGSPIFDERGQIKSAVLCLRDITAQVENDKIIDTQKDLLLHKEIEKNETLCKAIEMKDEFISLISHEFRTPLSVIKTAVDVMELSCGSELSDRGRDYLGKIRRSAYRQMKLVNNLLDITRVNAGRLEVHVKNLDIVAYSRAITKSIQIFAKQKEITLAFSAVLKQKVITLDEEKYERVLLNLLSNAIKYSPKGTSVSVKLKEAELDGIKRISIQIRDHGIGIPQEKLGMIFEKFGQVDNSPTRTTEGSGIGLYLVKMLVELMKGTISVSSKVGVGTTFTVLLPDYKSEIALHELTYADVADDRIVKSSEIEFSDIYF